ncbi:transmembrane protein 230-like [Chenopodium quinoa]|uniref:transmembrane protein 230-like n=1 Tax=Chenopodium quinoa TaxID=63459 RepID=UPI000B773BE4|nr:transmembrane protein 230-like [Chenopodium quinoa]XP_021737747.1 transmembrane protein 230-like [Chenopodium quinoa]XP_021771567.1 transmembrane protein 230-like [Chenopodium quinoa]
MASRRNVKYSHLATDEDGVNDYNDDGHIKGKPFDPRFDYTPKCLDKVPWKSIILALFLLFLGSFLLFLSFFIFTGHMGGERSQAYGLLALGILSFLPGFYETRIAYYSWRGAAGYRFAAIPDY